MVQTMLTPPKVRRFGIVCGRRFGTVCGRRFGIVCEEKILGLKVYLRNSTPR